MLNETDLELAAAYNPRQGQDVTPLRTGTLHPVMSSLIPEAQARLQNINRLLEDIYSHPRLLSDILRDAGMGEDEIIRLRRDHLDAYLGGLLGRPKHVMKRGVALMAGREDQS